MKRASTLILALYMLLTAVAPIAALAVESTGDTTAKPPTNVTITVVMPEPTPKPAPEPTPTPGIKVYPSDVTETREGGVWHIVKTYELNANENPADIPRGDFERSGWKFTLTDIIRKETANAETREHTETVTVNTETKELEKILPLFAPTMDYTAEDGFVGILNLDVASIKVETAGTRTTSYEMKVIREYPRLSANDTSLVPKTVTENGKTYNLAGVDWKTGNYSTVDYEQIADYYTAVATYTATGTSTKVTGYTSTAIYSGTLAKLIQGKMVYTAYFLGEEIRTPLEMVNLPEAAESPTEKPTPEPVPAATATPTPEPTAESTEKPTTQPTEQPTEKPTAQPTEEPAAPVASGGTSPAIYAVIALLAALLAANTILYIKNRKGNTRNEKTHHIDFDSDDDDGDDDAGSGG